LCNQADKVPIHIENQNKHGQQAIGISWQTFCFSEFEVRVLNRVGEQMD
jgi:hypothetical protein